MKLSAFFDPEVLLFDYSADCFDRVLEEFAGRFATVTGASAQTILEKLRQREELGGTYIGNGVSLPHCRMEHVRGVHAGFIRLAEPLPAEGGIAGPDDTIRYAVGIVTGTGSEGDYLAFLAAVSRLLQEHPEILDASDAGRFLAGVEQSGSSKLRSLTARDLCSFREPVGRGATIAGAVDRMKQEQVMFLPVSDSDGTICGSVSILTLIRAAFPEYVLGLTDLSFLNEFQPMEKFWADEAELPVADYMEEADRRFVDADATYLEVLFLMCKHSSHHLIVRDSGGRYLGIINERTILNKMLRP